MARGGLGGDEGTDHGVEASWDQDFFNFFNFLNFFNFFNGLGRWPGVVDMGGGLEGLA